ncbi:MAG: YbaB/EbfC family nucleoid-associated protein [Gallionella sp.]|nr:YbaB/EbfC family nucleoid-associated protein [Gallionella sp.]
MMKGGLGGLMKQAQQMQKNMQQAQAELATVEVEGQAASGMVKVTMSCSHDVRRLSLDDSILSDKEILEDLIVLALNDAVKKVAATTEQRMSGFGAGMGLPPGMKLPF